VSANIAAPAPSLPQNQAEVSNHVAGRLHVVEDFVWELHAHSFLERHNEVDEKRKLPGGVELRFRRCLRSGHFSQALEHHPFQVTEFGFWHDPASTAAAVSARCAIPTSFAALEVRGLLQCIVMFAVEKSMLPIPPPTSTEICA
jgi:hypothetical protein